MYIGNNRSHSSRSAIALIYNQMVVDELCGADADRVFHALSASTRRDILARAIREEQSVSNLAAQYEMSFAAVQKHVAVLQRAGLVTKTRRGREQLVGAEPATLRRARQLLGAYEQQIIDRANAIDDLLSERETERR